MRSAIQMILVALMVAVLANPQWFAVVSAEVTGYYSAASVAIVLLVLGQVSASHVLTGTPPVPLERERRRVLVVFPFLLVALAAVLVIKFLLAFRGVPIDPMRADMLPAILAGARRFIGGNNPYILYTNAAPWPVHLPYGPVLWMPYLLPTALRFDPRFLTTFCMALVVAFMLAKCLELARRGELFLALLLAGLVLTVFANKPVIRFVAIGHTQVYWPLLVVLHVAIAKDRLRAASFVLGLLAVGRTTMLSIMPIHLVYVFHRDRGEILKCSLLALSGIALPFLPFAWVDYRSLYESLVLNYVNVRPAIWARTDWIYPTFGVVSCLVRNDLGRYLTYVQLLGMALVYTGALVFVRRKAHVMPWMGLALLTFSMTVIWPVRYIYFDVLVLLTLAAIPMVKPFAAPAPFRAVAAGPAPDPPTVPELGGQSRLL